MSKEKTGKTLPGNNSIYDLNYSDSSSILVEAESAESAASASSVGHSSLADSSDDETTFVQHALFGRVNKENDESKNEALYEVKEFLISLFDAKNPIIELILKSEALTLQDMTIGFAMIRPPAFDKPLVFIARSNSAPDISKMSSVFKDRNSPQQAQKIFLEDPQYSTLLESLGPTKNKGKSKVTISDQIKKIADFLDDRLLKDKKNYQEIEKFLMLLAGPIQKHVINVLLDRQIMRNIGKTYDAIDAMDSYRFRYVNTMSEQTRGEILEVKKKRREDIIKLIEAELKKDLLNEEKKAALQDYLKQLKIRNVENRVCAEDFIATEILKLRGVGQRKSILDGGYYMLINYKEDQKSFEQKQRITFDEENKVQFHKLKFNEKPILTLLRKEQRAYDLQQVSSCENCHATGKPVYENKVLEKRDNSFSNSDGRSALDNDPVRWPIERDFNQRDDFNEIVNTIQSVTSIDDTEKKTMIDKICYIASIQNLQGLRPAPSKDHIRKVRKDLNLYCFVIKDFCATYCHDIEPQVEALLQKAEKALSDFSPKAAKAVAGSSSAFFNPNNCRESVKGKERATGNERAISEETDRRIEVMGNY